MRASELDINVATVCILHRQKFRHDMNLSTHIFPSQLFCLRCRAYFNFHIYEYNFKSHATNKMNMTVSVECAS